MICARCDLRIDPAEPFIRHDNPGASGAGMTTYVHRGPCRRAQKQTAPAPVFGSRRRR
jgi:hypothetical protein